MMPSPSLRGVLVVAVALLTSPASAEPQHRQFYRWNAPELSTSDLARRQTPPPGYHPEFGTCGSGTTCENACGTNWLSCKASTDLSLFCYNKVQLKQTCCENGSGRACDNGFYCAWNTFGGRVWCCKNGQSRKECGVDDPTTTTGPPRSSSTTTSSNTKTTTTTVPPTCPTTCPTCPAVCPTGPDNGSTGTGTVTSISTVTSVSTVTSALSGTLVITSTVTVYTNLPPDVRTITVISRVLEVVTETETETTTTTTTVVPEGCTATLPPGITTTTPGWGGPTPGPTKGHGGGGHGGYGGGETVTKGYWGEHPGLVAVVIDETRSGYVTAVVTGGAGVGTGLGGGWGVVVGVVVAGLGMF